MVPSLTWRGFVFGSLIYGSPKNMPSSAGRHHAKSKGIRKGIRPSYSEKKHRQQPNTLHISYPGGRARKTAPPSLTLPWERGWGGELYPCVGDPVHDDDGVDAGVAGSPFFHENVGRVRGVVDGIPGGSIEWMDLRGTAGKVKTLGSSGRPNECRANSANEQNYVTVQLGSFLFATTKTSVVCGESSIEYLVDELMNGWI